MFRYLNPIRVFRSKKQTVHPTGSLISDPTTTPPAKPSIRTQIRQLPGGSSVRRAQPRRKRIRFADEQKLNEESEEENEGGGVSDSYNDGRRQVVRTVRKKAKTSTTADDERRLRMKSSDGEVFEVDAETMTASSDRIKEAVEGGGYCPGEVITVPEVTGRVMAIAIEYCEKRGVKDWGFDEEEEKEWAEGLFKADQSTFFDLTLAAYHLKIESLMDLSCRTVTDMIRGKSPDEINQILKIQGGTANAAAAAAALLPTTKNGQGDEYQLLRPLETSRILDA